MGLLLADHLHVTKNKRAIINDLSFKVGHNEIVGLLGPNGSGKTTTFKLIMGFERLQKGRLFFNEKNISNFTIDQRVQSHITYLPQEPSIFQELSVADNIQAVFELNPDHSRDECHEKTEALLKTFQLTHLKTQKGSNLSGGERRRTEIARAMACQPKLLLMDEPFAGIDPIAIDGLKTLIKQVSQQGVAVLITDHNVKETLSLCDRAYMLYKGQCIAEGTEQYLIKHQQVKATYLGNLYDNPV
jgi:lipopolysaccharide export system ATP-binding protein